MANDTLLGEDIQPVLDMVRTNRPVSEVEAVPCPRCGGKLSVCFGTNGSDFVVLCSGPGMHMSKRQDISNPPDWWRQRIGDFGPVTYFYPRMSKFAPDGTITIRATGWTDEGHWTGAKKVQTDSSEYEFWRWVVANSERWPDFFSDRELPKLRDEFAHVGYPMADEVPIPNPPLSAEERSAAARLTSSDITFIDSRDTFLRFASVAKGCDGCHPLHREARAEVSGLFVCVLCAACTDSCRSREAGVTG